MKDQSQSHHPLVTLARKSIEAHLNGKALPDAADVPGFEEPAGAFVSLKKGGDLRGCIGTIQPVHPTLAEEVISNAVSAATSSIRPGSGLSYRAVFVKGSCSPICRGSTRSTTRSGLP
jgi:AMMECR1 domain-containing protein